MSNSELRIARPDWNGPGKPPVVKGILVTKLLLKLVGFDTSHEEHVGLLNQPIFMK